ncbi:hypothetical protein HY622_00010 [Candidatus Uhrbacteria bacterium]|nr:hypothetical protein [Candidatus Uhrbacteria bacterium]
MKKNKYQYVVLTGFFFIFVATFLYAKDLFAQGTATTKLNIQGYILAKQYIIPNKNFTKGASTMVSVRRSNQNQTCNSVCSGYHQDSCVSAYRRMTYSAPWTRGRRESEQSSITCADTTGVPSGELREMNITSFSVDCTCAKYSTQNLSGLSSRGIIDGRVQASDFIVESKNQSGVEGVLSTLIVRKSNSNQTCNELCNSYNRNCVGAIDAALGYPSQCNRTSTGNGNELYCLCGRNYPY